MPAVSLSPLFNGWQGFTPSGLPLALGTLQTFLAGTNTPLLSYTDSTGTIANATNIPLDAGGRPPAEIWLQNAYAYKFVLLDVLSNVIGTYDNIIGIGANPAVGAFDPTFPYPVGTLGGAEIVGPTNLGWFSSADPTGGTNSTTAANQATALGHAFRIPDGTYKLNQTLSRKIIVEGDGSNDSILRANNTALAIHTYTATSPYWTYDSEITGVGYYGTAKVGVGFTFGKTDPATYVAGDELANNVKFLGTYTDSLEKGVQFPFGNIGTEFYSCGSSSNYYGYYLLDNKYSATPGASIMHAGNKYWYSGEMNTNTCAVYINNATDGFGGVSFRDTIFEQNQIAFYCKTNSTFTPVVFDNVWLESNGFLHDGTANVTIDTWTGTVKSTASIANHAIVLDGTQGIYNFNGGFFTDAHVRGTNTQVLSRGSRVEASSGFAGQPCIVDNADSVIHIVDPATNGGLPNGNRVIVSGIVNQQGNFTIDNNATNAAARVWYGPHRTSIRPTRSSVGASQRMQTPLTTSGSISVTGSIVSDGILFPTCNEFSLNFTTGGTEVAIIGGTSVTMTAGWWVASVDVKASSGTPLFGIFDGAGATIFGFGVPLPSLNEWHTLCFMGKAPTTMATAALRVNSSSIALATVRTSAFQWQRFDTKHEAQLYLASGAFSDIQQGGGIGTVTSATYTVVDGDEDITFDRAAGTVTVTLPDATMNSGRVLWVNTIQAQTVVSASSNVVPVAGGAAGTAILAGTAGKWARLRSNGTNWQNRASN